MARTKTSLSVGIFVLIGSALAVAAIVWLGMSMRFEEGLYYAAYFDESVQGLSKDSPVKYRGVSVGRVKSIELAPDTTLIEVILKIESGLKPEADMVAQLKSVGITGIMYVELDRRDPDVPDLSPKIGFPSNYPVIATRPSEISRFFGEIGSLLERIGTIDLEGISTHLKDTLNGVRQAVADLNTAAISTDLRRSLKQVADILDSEKWHHALTTLQTAARSFGDFSESADRAVQTIDRAAVRFDGLLARNEPDLTAAIAELNRSTSAALQLLRRGDRLIGNADLTLADLKRQLVVTLQHLEASGQNLKMATETVSEQPARLIFGRAPPDRTLPKETAP